MCFRMRQVQLHCVVTLFSHPNCVLRVEYLQRISKEKWKAIIVRRCVVKQALLRGPSVMDWDVTSCQLIWCRGWVTSLWSASASLAQTPSAQPFHIPAPSASIPVPPHTTPIHSPASFGPLGPRQEKPHSPAHTPALPLFVYHFLSSILRCLPL